MDGKSLNISEEKLKQLKELLPEAFTEGKIDWEKLKLALGENINIHDERYVLNWAGKSDAFRSLQQQTTATLVPAKDESVNFDSTENIFIEGENLEVLKVLQKAYFGKIKMIYIDPPYNTGNDSFIYPDKFSESKDDYLKRIGDKDEEGYLLKEGLFRKNSKDSGRYHSNWLSMMYSRLYIARNLLKDDGVIFVSIDDNEVHNLRMIMNEIFGEENFLAQFVVQSNPRGSQSNKYSAVVHEYVIAYAKNSDDVKSIGIELPERMKLEYKFEDKNGRKYRLLGLRQRGGAWRRSDRPSLFFPIFINPKTEEISLVNGKGFNVEVLPIKPTTNEEGSWRWSKSKISGNENDLIGKLINRDGKDEWDIYQKDYFTNSDEKEKTTKVKTIWNEKEVNYQNGSEEVKKIFNDSSYFDFPKPTYIIKKIIRAVEDQKDTSILDFFAGSATTAQAVMELNKEDGGNRKFILAQIPEKTVEDSEAYKAGYFTIADIAKERIRRVIKKLENSGKEKDSKKEKQTEQTELELAEGHSNLVAEPLEKFKQIQSDNLGFKVFKLAPSNFKTWRTDIIETEEELSKMLKLFEETAKDGRDEENILFELLLKSGYELTSKIEIKNSYYSIADGELIIVLKKINNKIVDEIIKTKPANCIILDKLFAGNDQLKTNTALQMKDAGIEFKTI